MYCLTEVPFIVDINCNCDVLVPHPSIKSHTNSSQNCPTTQQGEGCTLGLTKEQPADSCYHIFTCNPHGQSGMHWICNGPTAEEGAHQFFCELEEERCGLRGLMRVAHINMSEPCSTCPPPLAQYWANGTKVCGPAVDFGCDSVVFPVHGWSTTMSVAEQWDTRFVDYCPSLSTKYY